MVPRPYLPSERETIQLAAFPSSAEHTLHRKASKSACAQVADVLAKHLAPEVLREAVLSLVHCAEGSGAAQVLDEQINSPECLQSPERAVEVILTSIYAAPRSGHCAPRAHWIFQAPCACTQHEARPL